MPFQPNSRRTLTVALAALALAVASLACTTVLPAPVPELIWDPAADALVVDYECGGGMVPANVYANAIPPLRIWGDGHMLWTGSDAAGGRRVLTAQLSPDEMRGVLQHMADSGFFGFRDEYMPAEPVMDAGGCSLSVQLTGASKRVSVNDFGEPPAAYVELANWLMQGAGAVGSDYVPERAYLTAFLILDQPGQAGAVWPAEGIDGVRLTQAQGGLMVEGEAARAAWEIVNRDPNTIVESGGASYLISVQVEDVTTQWPTVP